MPVLNKRPPEAFPGDLYWKYQKISKADWADIFADIYREAFGPEDADGAEILEDAKRRLTILQGYRKQRPLIDPVTDAIEGDARPGKEYPIVARIKSFTAISTGEAEAVQVATEEADTFVDGLAFDVLIDTHTTLISYVMSGIVHFCYVITVVFEHE